LASASDIDYRSILASVTQPVELVWGAEDQLMGERDLTEMRALLNVVQEYELPDCGHWPWIENIEGLLTFLKTARG
jgi:pimeloyl-ACP methyl ester carboxylesterase